MPQLVSELDLPYLDTVGLERREAIDAIAAARAVHWLARTELGYSVIRQQDVTAILRDQRFHSALSMISGRPRCKARAPGSRRASRSWPWRVTDHARLRRLVAPAFTPAAADRLRPFMREVVGDWSTPSSAPAAASWWPTSCEPYPIPIICELLGRPARGLEALLGVGHRHLPDLQPEPGRGPPRSSSGPAASSRPTCSAMIAQRRAEPARRPAERPHRRRGGRATGCRPTNWSCWPRPCSWPGPTPPGTSWPAAWPSSPSTPTSGPCWPSGPSSPRGRSRSRCATWARSGAPSGSPPRTSTTATSSSPGHPGLRCPWPGPTGTPAPSTPPTSSTSRASAARPQMTFGSGIHFCMGAALARAELQEALPLLARRLPELARRRSGRVEAGHLRHLGPGPPAPALRALVVSPAPRLRRTPGPGCGAPRRPTLAGPAPAGRGRHTRWPRPTPPTDPRSTPRHPTARRVGPRTRRASRPAGAAARLDGRRARRRVPPAPPTSPGVAGANAPPRRRAPRRPPARPPAPVGMRRSAAPTSCNAVDPGARVAQRHLGGRVEVLPAVAGEPDLHPGVGVLGLDLVEVGDRVVAARDVADRLAGGDAEGAQHHGQRGRDLLAVARPVAEEELVHRVGPGGEGRDVRPSNACARRSN